ncbi:MAG TPA: ATP-binding protein [Spirochaetota bacterium]|jgi:predicted AAA+ superfamily ATPase|nr:ATP-binding protein [Spirochaetota bacterium]HPV42795.1 ATP-binding protein [Spirochaetota bacterium]
MIKRKISDKVLQLARQYPVVTITGPRQSGKTTLCKQIFRDRDYVSLEDLDEREFARSDPRGFLKRFPDGAVIDEVQRVPDLLSYIQTLVDEKGGAGHFILTGSHQFDLLGSVAQSLAGRTALVHLLPFSSEEIYPSKKGTPSLDETIYRGFYPRIHDRKLNPTEALSFYVSTYIERDLRNIINIKDLSVFETFLKLCAGRCGQIVNLSGIGNDCGINHATVKNWLSVLEASGIVRMLRPYFKNFNKRLIKSPKLYFLDTGLAAYLLGITTPAQVSTHPLRGALFECFVVSELLKMRFNAVKPDNLYFFRDNIGNEVDVIMDFGTTTQQVEIKSGMTVSEDSFKGLRYIISLNKKAGNSYLVYGGEKSLVRDNIKVLGWMDVRKIEV